MMQRFSLYLLAVPLSLLILSCGTESTEPPLVPEILAIEIQDASTTTNVYAPVSSTFSLEQLIVDVTYSNGETVQVIDDLQWVSRSGSSISNAIAVVNGIIFVVGNHADANVSVSFREKIHTKTDKLVHVVPLSTIKTIKVITDSNVTVLAPSEETNVSVPTGESIKLEANGLFEDNKTIDNINQQIVWELSDYTIATVNRTTGQLNILKPGKLDVNVSVFTEVKAQVTLNITTK